MSQERRYGGVEVFEDLKLTGEKDAGVHNVRRYEGFNC